MIKDDLMQKFKAETGRKAVRETHIELEECEYIDDYYLISKTDADSVTEDSKLKITVYENEYVEWLEEQIEKVKSIIL